MSSVLVMMAVAALGTGGFDFQHLPRILVAVAISLPVSPTWRLRRGAAHGLELCRLAFLGIQKCHVSIIGFLKLARGGSIAAGRAGGADLADGGGSGGWDAGKTWGMLPVPCGAFSGGRRAFPAGWSGAAESNELFFIYRLRRSFLSV
jgi:hypothetical protein